MKLDRIIKDLDLKVLTSSVDLGAVEVESGYCSDLLSCVMTGAEPNSVWVTLMAHGNIVAVAALLDISAVIITEDAQPEEGTLKLAREKGVTLLSSPHDSFYIIGKLWELGLRAKQD
jgi:hypothetical protein